MLQETKEHLTREWCYFPDIDCDRGVNAEKLFYGNEGLGKEDAIKLAKSVCMSKGFTGFVVVNSWNPSTQESLGLGGLVGAFGGVERYEDDELQPAWQGPVRQSRFCSRAVAVDRQRDDELFQACWWNKPEDEGHQLAKERTDKPDEKE